MLATVRRLSFHYTPLPTKYLYDPPPDRHRLTTYAKIKLEKIAPERILSKRWGSWVSRHVHVPLLLRRPGALLSPPSRD